LEGKKILPLYVFSIILLVSMGAQNAFANHGSQIQVIPSTSAASFTYDPVTGEWMEGLCRNYGLNCPISSPCPFGFTDDGTGPHCNVSPPNVSCSAGNAYNPTLGRCVNESICKFGVFAGSMGPECNLGPNTISCTAGMLYNPSSGLCSNFNPVVSRVIGENGAHLIADYNWPRSQPTCPGGGSLLAWNPIFGGCNFVDPTRSVCSESPEICCAFSNVGPRLFTCQLVFLDVIPGQIGDTVFRDGNNDGAQDAGDPGLEGVTVNLVCTLPDGTTINDSQVTDANGIYLFTGIPAGVTCNVTVDETTAPDDTEPGDNCPDSFNVDVLAGAAFLDADFCFKSLTTNFLVIDEDSISDDNAPNFFTKEDVNEEIADIGVRDTLPGFSGTNVGTTITLHTGEVGDEGWYAITTIPSSWDAAGPIIGDGLRNFFLAGPGLGTEDAEGDREALLDKIPDVTPLRFSGLKLLEGERVCAVVYDGDVGMNYGSDKTATGLEASLKGSNIGIVAFIVNSMTPVAGLPDFSDKSLPVAEIEILDAEEQCENEFELLTGAPVPTSSSEPEDVRPL